MEQNLPVLREPEPNKRSNWKVITIVVILFIGILTIIFFNSPLSNITDIKITGTQYLNSSEVMDASGIKVGNSFFFNTTSDIEKRISTLQAVDKVIVSKGFPGKLKLTIIEHSVIAFELKENGQFIALLEGGASLPTSPDRLQIIDKPILTGWEKEQENKGRLINELSHISLSEISDISEISPIPSAAFPDRILIFTRTKFEVVTAISLFREKIEAMNGVIETQVPGKLTLLLADTYVPFFREDMESE